MRLTRMHVLSRTWFSHGADRCTSVASRPVGERRDLVSVEWSTGDHITLRYSTGDASGITGSLTVAVALAAGAGLHRVEAEGVMRWERVG